ncbi:MAG: ABC transporter substrate-binding protein [Actinobacteria bacterium]|nr:ABC transporter substrate-binding protein [Actinomycetota bacterium]
MHVRRTFALLAAAITAVATLFATVPAAGQSTPVPGVTKDEIRVGGIAGVTNPVGRPYGDAFKGIQAYFDAVNKAGGVHGRKLKFVAGLDDQSRASQNLLAARSLVEEKKVFAVAPIVTNTFASAKYLADKGVPTFGWNIQTDWTAGPNLFGEKGSYLAVDDPIPMAAFSAQKAGAKRVGLLAYGTSPQSAKCLDGQRQALEKWGPPIGFADSSLAFGFSANDVAAAVQAVKDNDVDFIATCMDVNGVVNLAKQIRQAGITDVGFLAPEGYDPEVLKTLGKDLEGFTFAVQFLPFEVAKESEEMQRFLTAMKKARIAPSEQALAGWQNGALLVEGIKRAGKDFTQQSVVDAINGITSWTANGLRPAVNWTTAHGPTPPGGRTCSAYVQVKNGKFVPVYNEPGKPYACFTANPFPASLSSVQYSAE